MAPYKSLFITLSSNVMSQLQTQELKTYLDYGDFENDCVKTGLNLNGLILSDIFMISERCKAFSHTWHHTNPCLLSLCGKPAEIIIQLYR